MRVPAISGPRPRSMMTDSATAWFLRSPEPNVSYDLFRHWERPPASTALRRSGNETSVRVVRLGLDRDFTAPLSRNGDAASSAAHNAVGLAGESPVVGIDCLPT